MDQQRTDATVCHFFCSLLNRAVGRDCTRFLLDQIAHLYGKQIQVLITSVNHLMLAQFAIDTGNNFFGKTFQVILGKTGLVVNQVKKKRPGQEETEGILHGFDIQVGRSTSNNAKSTNIGSFTPVVLEGNLLFIIDNKRFYPALLDQVQVGDFGFTGSEQPGSLGEKINLYMAGHPLQGFIIKLIKGHDIA